MCNATPELGVEHPRGPHRVQHVQHLFNTCLSQVLNNRKRDFSPPRAHWLSYIQASMVHQCECAFGLQYMSPLQKKHVSTLVYEPNAVC